MTATVDVPLRSFRRWRLAVTERTLSIVMRRLLPFGLSTQPVSIDHLPPARRDHGYGLYLHVPFCETLCPYCSFHRVPFRCHLAVHYFDGLEQEMRMAAALGYRFDTLYVGGGTPTVEVERLIGVIKLARELFGVRHVSCETHAHHLRPDIAGRLTGHVQRLSVGVQTLDPEILRLMRREPDLFPPEATLNAIRSLHSRFPTLNIDLIFNLPGQTIGGLQRDLDRVLETGVTQVTTYPLMSSPKHAHELEQQFGRQSSSREYEMFELIEARMARERMRASSPWCYSRQGDTMIDEYIVDTPEYVGLGSGAFSLLGGGWYVNTFSLARYSERIREGRMSVERMRQFRPWELMHYRLMMGLFGLDLDRAGISSVRQGATRILLALELALLRRAGAFQPGCFALTHSGRYLSLAMMREFFAGMNRVRDEARALLPAWQRGEFEA